MYVIKRGSQCVSKPGSKNSYTNALQCAQTFSTKEAAEANKCGNEYVVPVEDEMK